MDNRKENKRTFGSEGEDIAVKYLSEKGFEIIERNYFAGHGEIDIIAKDPRDNYLVFVEVKTRNSMDYGDPAYAINKKKILQIKKNAELYLADKNIQEQDCRFDVVTVLMIDPENPQIEHYENAFM
ncbi:MULTISPECIES: YraN family protein [Ignavibacterium]|jgi:putative endonuclease|uniref:YraN family protein n=1 Tax=Ignavibacterium TaxID=795750 RepID=UPI0025C3B2E4|nr:MULTISPECIES: YraN family protein [Ignavibacterium]MBI5660592.1 YraN family protein [Ignavibacterium album]